MLNYRAEYRVASWETEPNVIFTFQANSDRAALVFARRLIDGSQLEPITLVGVYAVSRA